MGFWNLFEISYKQNPEFRVTNLEIQFQSGQVISVVIRAKAARACTKAEGAMERCFKANDVLSVMFQYSKYII